jgi:hypothetical protein
MGPHCDGITLERNTHTLYFKWLLSARIVELSTKQLLSTYPERPKVLLENPYPYYPLPGGRTHAYAKILVPVVLLACVFQVAQACGGENPQSNFSPELRGKLMRFACKILQLRSAH